MVGRRHFSKDQTILTSRTRKYMVGAAVLVLIVAGGALVLYRGRAQDPNCWLHIETPGSVAMGEEVSIPVRFENCGLKELAVTAISFDEAYHEGVTLIEWPSSWKLEGAGDPSGRLWLRFREPLGVSEKRSFVIRGRGSKKGFFLPRFQIQFEFLDKEPTWRGRLLLKESLWHGYQDFHQDRRGTYVE